MKSTFKKDDIVVCIGEGVNLEGADSLYNGGMGFKKNKIVKIKSAISGIGNYDVLWPYDTTHRNNDSGIYSNNVRYATNEEIKAYNNGIYNLNKTVTIMTII
jgi:hypothetical protein